MNYFLVSIRLNFKTQKYCVGEQNMENSVIYVKINKNVNLDKKIPL